MSTQEATLPTVADDMTADMLATPAPPTELHKEDIKVPLFNQAVLDAIDMAANYHVPTTFPKGKPGLTLCGQRRLTENMDGKCPIVWVMGLNMRIARWAFGFHPEYMSPPTRGVFLPAMPGPQEPLRWPEVESILVTDHSTAQKPQRYIQQDKPMSGIVLDILALFTLPSRDGFAEKGMTKMEFGDIWHIFGDAGQDHFQYSTAINRAVLRDDSVLAEHGNQLGLPLIVGGWLGGHSSGHALILPTKTLRSSFNRAVEVETMRVRARRVPRFATSEEKAEQARMRESQPLPAITLFRGMNTFPLWVWEVLHQHKVELRQPKTNMWDQSSVNKRSWSGEWSGGFQG